METSPGECYACIVGVWTGPESHSPGCVHGRAKPPDFDSMVDRMGTLGIPITEDGVRHVIRIGDGDDNDHYRWECSCGRAGSSENPDVHSDRHIDHERGDTRVDSNKGLDEPW